MYRGGAGELERALFNSATVVAALPAQPLWCLTADGGMRACRSWLVEAEEARVLRYNGACAAAAVADCWRMARRAVRDDALAPWRGEVATHVQQLVDHLASEQLLRPGN